MADFICRKNNSDVMHFTDGKVYPAFKNNVGGFWILDDSNYSRCILGDGKPDPHLVRRYKDMYGQECQVCAGFFERVVV